MCSVVKPRYCPLNEFNIFNIYSYFDKKCPKTVTKKEYSTTSDYFMTDVRDTPDTYIGLSTSSIGIEERQNTFFNNILINSEEFDTVQEGLESGFEIFLKQTKSAFEYIFNIKKKQSLIDKRAEKSNQNSLSKNVIVLYIDQLSRPHAHRKLPKTISWFNKQRNSDITEGGFNKNEERKSYEFFRYHSASINPYANFMEFWYNNIEEYQEFFSLSTPEDNKKPQEIQYYFKKNGYITAHTSDYCSSFSFQTYSAFLEDYKINHADHENFITACDINYAYQNQHEFFGKGPHSPFHRCIYGKNSFEYNFDYIEQFQQVYQDEKKFMFLEFSDAAEPTGEIVQYMDDYMFSFLENLEKLPDFKDTTVILMSTKGLTPQNFNLFSIKKIEESLPSLFLSIPTKTHERLNNDQLINIELNQQKLIAPSQIYHSLRSIAEGTSYKQFEKSIFGKLPSDTDCTSAINSVEDEFTNTQFCACKSKPK